MNTNLKQKFQYNMLIYPTMVMLLNWADVLRFCFACNDRDDSVSVFSEKLPVLVILLQGAVIQTSYSGTLNRILSELKITPDLAKLIYRRACVMIVVNVCTIISLLGIFMCVLSQMSHDFDFYIAPFVTLIPISDEWLIVAKLTFIISFLTLQQGMHWPTAMNVTLTEVIVRRFNMCSSQFSNAINRRGQFNGDMRSFKRIHQDVTEVVHSVDSIMRFGNFLVSCAICLPSSHYCTRLFLTVKGHLNKCDDHFFKPVYCKCDWLGKMHLQRYTCESYGMFYLVFVEIGNVERHHNKGNS
jgi:hypothetical protein